MKEKGQKRSEGRRKEEKGTENEMDKGLVGRGENV